MIVNAEYNSNDNYLLTPDKKSGIKRVQEKLGIKKFSPGATRKSSDK